LLAGPKDTGFHSFDRVFHDWHICPRWNGAQIGLLQRAHPEHVAQIGCQLGFPLDGAIQTILCFGTVKSSNGKRKKPAPIQEPGNKIDFWSLREQAVWGPRMTIRLRKYWGRNLISWIQRAHNVERWTYPNAHNIPQPEVEAISKALIEPAECPLSTCASLMHRWIKPQNIESCELLTIIGIESAF